MATTTVGPTTITGGAPFRMTPPHGGVGRFSCAILYNLSGMPVLVGATRWLAPFSADYFPWTASSGYFDIDPITLATANTGTLLAMWCDPDSDPGPAAYPVPMPPGTVTVAPPPAGTFNTLSATQVPFYVPSPPGIPAVTVNFGVLSAWGAWTQLTANIGASANGYSLLRVAVPVFPPAAGGNACWCQVGTGAAGFEVSICDIAWWAWFTANGAAGLNEPTMPCPQIPAGSRVSMRLSTAINALGAPGCVPGITVVAN